MSQSLALEFFEGTAFSGITPAPRSAAHETLSLPCVYCRGPIPASTFAFWSTARRLVSATCPECQRRVTLATSTWRRWLKQPVA
jgi:hypothetical protein